MNAKIQKIIEPSFKSIRELLGLNDVVTDGPVPLNSRNVTITKVNKEFEISFVVRDGERTLLNNILDIKIGQYYIKGSSGRVYVVPDRSTLLSAVRQIDDTYDFNVKGSITQIASSGLADFENKFHRVLVPVPDVHFSFRDYEHFSFDADNSASSKELMLLTITGLKFHLYTFRIDSNIYWAIDSLQQLSFRTFQEIAHSIFITFGFLEGDWHQNEGYYFSSDHIDFHADLNLFYFSLRDSVLTGYGMITTNPSSVLVPYAQSRGKKFEYETAKPWLARLKRFTTGQFEKIAEYFYEFDSLKRAALITLAANTQALELKAATYCIAFEAICHTIKSIFGIESDNVIESSVWESVVKLSVIELLNNLQAKGSIDKKQLDILLARLNNWNQPTNADTLSAPFSKFGYILSADEIKCIKDRNILLHGGIPIKKRESELAFLEIYHIAMTIHKLIYVLILKLVGYGGYIINYPKIHEHISGKTLNEEPFILI